MRRGEVVLVDLDPVRPGEASKKRPCVIVSNDGANTAAARLGRGAITVVPLTSNLARIHSDFQVSIADGAALRAMGLSGASKVQAEQVRSVSTERLGDTLGWAPPHVLRDIDNALRFHLSL